MVLVFFHPIPNAWNTPDITGDLLAIVHFRSGFSVIDKLTRCARLSFNEDVFSVECVVVLVLHTEEDGFIERAKIIVSLYSRAVVRPDNPAENVEAFT